jgi:hypothetical protein
MGLVTIKAFDIVVQHLGATSNHAEFIGEVIHNEIGQGNAHPQVERYLYTPIAETLEGYMISIRKLRKLKKARKDGTV